MKISVVVVCFNEEKNIGDCLSSLVNQTYDRKNYEVLVVDNGSQDRTREIVGDFVRRCENVRLVVNPRRGIAQSRNVGVWEAKYGLIAFTDADCLAPAPWLEALAAGYRWYKSQDPSVIAVGGSNIPPPSPKHFYQALAIALDSFFIARNSVQGRVFSKDRNVPHLPCANVLYEKEKIQDIGGFDESFGSIIEDEDLSYRLKLAGFNFVYLAGAFVHHKMQDNLRDWAKRMFIYGKGRMWFLKKYPRRWSPVFAAPTILVLTLPLSGLLYLPVTLFVSLGECLKKGRVSLVFDVFLLYVVTHILYGCGEIYGLFKKRG